MKTKLISLVSGLLAIAVLIASIATAGPKVVEATEEPVVEEEVKAPEAATKPAPMEPQWHYFNLDLQGDGVEGNEYNFGCMPDCSVTPEAMDVAFRNRLNQDPALGAADMAWFDALLGTRYLGVFYDECDEEWDRAINKAKTDWIANPDDYFETLDAFFEYLDSAVSVEIREQKNLEDQMYMNPFTRDHIPDVIVMETDEHEGNFLVYTFVIKETKKIEVAYRLECGFQPTNVAEIMKITPKKRSGGGSITGGGAKPTLTGGGPKPGPNPTPTPKPTPTPNPTPTPGPTPTPTPLPKKDPSEGTPVLPNGDPGSGSNTNNPSDPNHSTKDQPTNSTELTPQEYKDAIDEIKEANESAGGGDTPSTPPPTSDTHVDSNASEADKPTEKSESSVSDEPAGESWDGPPD